ncbi:MAG: hypothetical protein R3D88_01365 [Alphaproteobacteria bacterium]|nr:hypothetical protein [Alphaproteobacteria bacterium]
MIKALIRNNFGAAALLLSTTATAVADEPQHEILINNPEINMLSCLVAPLEEHEQRFSLTQQLIEDSALTIGCLLQDQDDGYDNKTNIETAVLALQENLAAYAEANDMELADIPDGKLGPATTQDFIDVAMALKVDTIFRIDAFDPDGSEHIYAQRFLKELSRYNPSSVEAAQLWAMELEFEPTEPTLPNFFQDLPNVIPQLPTLPNIPQVITPFPSLRDIFKYQLPLCDGNLRLEKKPCIEEASARNYQTVIIPRLDI